MPVDDPRMSDGQKLIDAQFEQGKEAAKDILFGSIAGIVGKVIEYPFDTVKVRLQSQPAGLPPQYKGPVDCFRQSWRADGIAGLYRGITAPLVGAAVETSSLFFSVSLHRSLFHPNSRLNPATVPPRPKSPQSYHPSSIRAAPVLRPHRMRCHRGRLHLRGLDSHRTCKMPNAGSVHAFLWSTPGCFGNNHIHLAARRHSGILARPNGHSDP